MFDDYFIFADIKKQCVWFIILLGLFFVCFVTSCFLGEKKINFFLKKNIGIKHFLAYKKGSIYGNKQGVMKRVEQIRPQATPIPLCGNFAVFALGGYGLQSPTISLIFVVERNFTNQ